MKIGSSQFDVAEAKAGAYSSVVGNNVMLRDASGRAVCILALMCIPGDNHKTVSIELADFIARAINKEIQANDDKKG